MTTMVTWLTMEWPNLTLSFLQQVYTVVYDVAVREAMYKDLLALFHVFLTTLTSNLDIATVELSLGMMVQLQTDSQVHLKYPVSIGFLVYGYICTIRAQFRLENTAVGQRIMRAIGWRTQKGLWVQGLNVPSLEFEVIEWLELHKLTLHATTYTFIDRINIF